jgi:hypothetical protein
MPQWNRLEFEKEASKIASAFMNNPNASLTDMVVKCATDNQLFPEQIRTLSTILNNKVFNETMSHLAKTGNANNDRYVEFDVANPEQAINSTYKRPEEKVAQELYPDFEDEMKKPVIYQSFHKIAAAPETPKRNLEKEWLHLKEAEEYLRQERYRPQIQYRDAIEQLHNTTKRIGFNVSEFEKNAVALLGNSCISEIQLLRKSRGEPLLDVTSEKIASFQNRYIGRETPETILLKTALTAKKACIEAQQVYLSAKQKLATIESEIMHNAS